MTLHDSTINLIQGDCLEVMYEIDNNSVDLIVVDLPYGITQNKWDIIIPFIPMWDHIKKVLKDNGIVLFTSAQPFTSQLIMSNLEWYKYDIIWQKTIASGQLNVKRRPLRIHENILVFYNKFGVYNEQKEKGAPYKILRKAVEFEGNYGKQRDHTKINNGFRHAKSIIKIPNPRIPGGHKTEKPVKLMEYLIKTYSNKNDVVLDFVMGHGTTGEACINLDRNFIGIEKDKNWFNKSKKRLNSALTNRNQCLF